jgi:hypothetical protein
MVSGLGVQNNKLAINNSSSLFVAPIKSSKVSVIKYRFCLIVSSVHLDCDRGRPSLPQLVSEGIALKGEQEIVEKLKKEAIAGPLCSKSFASFFNFSTISCSPFKAIPSETNCGEIKKRSE